MLITKVISSSLTCLVIARRRQEKPHWVPVVRTAHFVTSQVDHGPIIIQAAVQTLPGDTEETLAARVLQQEHRIYPEAVRWFMEGRLKVADNHVEVSNAVADGSILYSPELS